MKSSHNLECIPQVSATDGGGPWLKKALTGIGVSSFQLTKVLLLVCSHLTAFWKSSKLKIEAESGVSPRGGSQHQL